MDGYSTSFKNGSHFLRQENKIKIFHYSTLLEDKQSFHTPQDTQGSKTPAGNTRFGREVHCNYTSIFSQSKRDKRFIINMDQTPIFFSMVPNTMLNRVGDQSVNVCSSSGSTMRVTVALAVTAAGGLLPPMFVFKAKPGGPVQRTLRNFPEGAVYAVQHNAWMDESVMLQWVDRVHKPWSETVPENIVPYLLLDSYKVHLMTTVT